MKPCFRRGSQNILTSIKSATQPKGFFPHAIWSSPKSLSVWVRRAKKPVSQALDHEKRCLQVSWCQDGVTLTANPIYTAICLIIGPPSNYEGTAPDPLLGERWFYGLAPWGIHLLHWKSFMTDPRAHQLSGLSREFHLRKKNTTDDYYGFHTPVCAPPVASDHTSTHRP